MSLAKMSKTNPQVKMM
jgi:hypothetical protein